MASAILKEQETAAVREDVPSGAPAPPSPREEAGFSEDLPERLRTLIARTPPEDWHRIRGFFIESEEAAELVDLIPGVNQAMRYCPARLMGRASRREITTPQIDQAYRELHDALSGMRQALLSLYALAGLPERLLVRGLAVPARIPSPGATRKPEAPGKRTEPLAV